MKVTKHNARAIAKKERRQQRGKNKSSATRRVKELQRVKMRLNLSSKEGHVGSIGEYIATIDKDITTITNATQPAVDLLDIVCESERCAAWRVENHERLSQLISYIEMADTIVNELRRNRDVAKTQLEEFKATNFENREDMIAFAYSTILSIATVVDTTREQYESVGISINAIIHAVKPELDAILE